MEKEEDVVTISKFAKEMEIVEQEELEIVNSMETLSQNQENVLVNGQVVQEMRHKENVVVKQENVLVSNAKLQKQDVNLLEKLLQKDGQITVEF